MSHSRTLPRRALSLVSTACILGLGSTVGVHELSAASPPACVTETSTDGADTVVQFKNVGQCSWVVPASVTSVSYLVVAGGGGGGGDAAGGGGAGGLLTNFGVSTLSVTPVEEVVVTVGNGGVAGHNGPSNDSGGHILPTTGGDSRFGAIVAFGGGVGGVYNSGNGGPGGSGGGGAFTSGLGGANTVGQGFIGGNGNNGGGVNWGSGPAGAGGGGAGGAGTVGNVEQGQGGPGKSVSISGSSTMYAGGGGGGRWSVNGSSPGANNGGSGGGGAGSIGCGNAATGALSNTGGGGGGAPAGCYGDGGRGGSGIVIVRYSIPVAPTNSAIPTISGTKRVGETLTATAGTWSSSPTSYSYQWKRASTVGGSYSDIGSASSANTYELTDDDIDKFIKVSVIATNAVGSSSAVLSDATSAISDLPASVVPTTSAAVSTADGFAFTILNYSNVYTYTLTTTSGSVTRSVDEVSVSGLGSGASATVTVRAARSGYRSASKTVAGSATVATTTTVKAVVTIDIQAPVSTVAQGQASVATVAPTTTGPAMAAAQVAVTTTPVPASTTTVKATPTTTTTVAPLQQSTASIAPPVIPKVSTGESALNVGGVSTKIELTRENNQLVMKSGALQATLSGLDDQGATRALDADGNLRLAAGDVVKINVGGFEPGSDVDVWLFSTPYHLGTAVVGPDGHVSGSFTIPKDIEDGAHRIAITTRLTNGKEATFTLGVAIGEIAKTSTLTRILIAIPITLAIGFGLILPTQYRRRRKTLTE